jgi:hypothetical protein
MKITYTLAFENGTVTTGAKLVRSGNDYRVVLDAYDHKGTYYDVKSETCEIICGDKQGKFTLDWEFFMEEDKARLSTLIGQDILNALKQYQSET